MKRDGKRRGCRKDGSEFQRRRDENRRRGKKNESYEGYVGKLEAVREGWNGEERNSRDDNGGQATRRDGAKGMTDKFPKTTVEYI